MDRDAALQLLHHAGIGINDRLDQGRDEAVPADQYLVGPSDRWALGAVRAEQGFLRNQQLELRGSPCSLCGQKLPDEFLVAAHIKPRFACTEQERRDVRNVYILACLFGCDALFERGYLVVGDYGTIEAGRPGPEPVEERIKTLVGRKCLAYDERSRDYFSWHRQTHIARQPQQP